MNSNEEQQSLAIVCPMANEGEQAADFVDAVLARCQKFSQKTFIAVIDRATRDNTLDVLRRHAAEVPELKVLWAPENRGVVDAYVRGYREALALEADWILEIDAGFSHRPDRVSTPNGRPTHNPRPRRGGVEA